MITSVALAAAATFVVLTGSTSVSAMSPQQAEMTELFTSYDPDTGLIGSHWWQAAVALSSVETYAQTTGDTSYNGAIARAFAAHASSKFENNSNDDTAWWALAWLQAYDITHVRAYLSMAQTEADYIHRDWDGTCGGGVWWQRSPRAYKNAISNELFLELTAWLHNMTPGDTKYLRWARAEWSWLDHSGMINDSDLVNDGLDDNCGNNAGVTWTYNQGVILAGLAQLYQATGDHSLLRRAERLARATIGQLTVAGVLAEPCEVAACADQLDNDTRAFKGIFVRDLKVLAVTARTTEFNSFFMKQAKSIAARDTDGYRQHGMYWAGPVSDVTSATQASALDALVASLNLPGTIRRSQTTT
ncbi:MAG TPA: glycoside hydrolase family 76 protein [Streptosporangiaceae bacterium]|nr:glycoside hydrolase family 76 protein [Streptosporangiaceae bacterium]